LQGFRRATHLAEITLLRAGESRIKPDDHIGVTNPAAERHRSRPLRMPQLRENPRIPVSFLAGNHTERHENYYA
jgi:hypothetical protein